MVFHFWHLFPDYLAMFLADRASTSHKKKSFKRGLILHRFLFSQCHSKIWADLHIVVFEGLFARHFFSTKTGKTAIKHVC